MHRLACVWSCLVAALGMGCVGQDQEQGEELAFSCQDLGESAEGKRMEVGDKEGVVTKEGVVMEPFVSDSWEMATGVEIKQIPDCAVNYRLILYHTDEDTFGVTTFCWGPTGCLCPATVVAVRVDADCSWESEAVGLYWVPPMMGGEYSYAIVRASDDGNVFFLADPEDTVEEISEIDNVRLWRRCY